MIIAVDAEVQQILGTDDQAIHGSLDIINAGRLTQGCSAPVPIHPAVSELIPLLLEDLRPAA